MDTAPMSRVVVETESAWLRVQENVDQSLKRAMEIRLASLPGGKDGEAARGVRKEVERRLDRIKDDMWKMTKPNLLVNGHNYEDFVEATEPFNEALDRRIWALNAERIGWDISVSEIRKQRPFHLRQTKQEMEQKRMAAEWLPDTDAAEDNQVKKMEDVPPPPRHAEVVETFGSVADNLTELAKTAPSQIHRAQRAQSVREEIGNLPQ